MPDSWRKTLRPVIGLSAGSDAARRAGDQRGEGLKVPRVDAAGPLQREPQRHDDLFQRGIAGPLAQSVNRHVDTAGARQHGGQRVRRGHAQIVVCRGIPSSVRHGARKLFNAAWA